LVGAKSEVIYKPIPDDDPRKRQPDITLAKKYLQWEPKVALEEGLKKTIAYFKGVI
jgi:UDP-glucuronate decarboxylase